MTAPRTAHRRAALALLLTAVLAACGGGGDEETGGGGAVTAEGAPDAQQPTVVGNAEHAFVPSTVEAVPGTLELTMEIEGGVPHNLVFDDEEVGADIALISEGSAAGTYTFSSPGTYDFVCTLHPGMDGEVVVS